MKTPLSRAGAACILALVLGCGHSAVAPIGYDADPYPIMRKPAKAAPPPPVPDDVVARAAAGVTLVRLDDRTELTFPAAASELLKNDALCVGEQHGDAALHYGEFALFERLSPRARDAGLELGVGFEMWASRFQAAVSRFALGKIGEETLLEETDYERRWGYAFAYYRPLVEAVRNQRLPLVALNAPREVTEQVAEKGLDELEPEIRKQIPTLELDDATHRADFARRMQSHPGVDAENLEHFYAAQVVWDETMAESAAHWLADHAPVRRLMIVAGQAHCQRSAIPNRLERRGARRVAAIWLGKERPGPDAAKQYDYALIVAGPIEPPPGTSGGHATPDSSLATRSTAPGET